MAFTKDTNRQYELVATATISIGDLTSGVAKELINLPGGATLTGGYYQVTTVFNSQSSDAVTISMNGHTYVTDTDATAKVHTDFTMPTTTNTGLATLTAPDTIDATWTGGGTKGTTGTIKVVAKYILAGRTNEVQP